MVILTTVSNTYTDFKQNEQIILLCTTSSFTDFFLQLHVLKKPHLVIYRLNIDIREKSMFNDCSAADVIKKSQCWKVSPYLYSLGLVYVI